MDIKILVELVKNDGCNGCNGYDIPCSRCPVDNGIQDFLGCSLGSGERARVLLSKYTKEEIFEALL